MFYVELICLKRPFKRSNMQCMHEIILIYGYIKSKDLLKIKVYTNIYIPL